MMAELTPAQMREILKHGSRYQRAVQLLHEDWNFQKSPIANQLVDAVDVSWARLLQRQELIDGHSNLDDYREVSQLIARYPQWFSAAGRQALLAEFE